MCKVNRLQKIIIYNPFLVGVLIFLIACVLSITPVYFLQQQHIKSYFQDFRTHLGELSATLATLIDGDLHKKIRKKEHLNDANYKKLITPLVKFHNANPKMIYVYTMIEKNGTAYYILDTMSDDRLDLARERLENTEVMEEVVVENPNDKTWINVLKSGKVYVNKAFETDNYGTFLSGHAPFYDSNGTLEGYVGIDYDTKGYESYIQAYKKIFANALVLSLLFSSMFALLITFFSYHLKSKYLQIDKLSKYDSLTGLFNRLTFETLVNENLKRVKRTKEHLFFIIVDIDDFKYINDSYGHQIGDSAITSVAKKLRTELRESDILARFGGDEFLISLIDKDPNAASNLVTRLETSFGQNPITLDNDIKMTLTLSIGYTMSKEDCTYESLLNRADQALYISKGTGKGIGTFMS